MEMRTEVPWLHVQLTRIYYDGGRWRLSANGELRHHRLLHQLQEDVNYFTKGFWAMDNGEWRM